MYIVWLKSQLPLNSLVLTGIFRFKPFIQLVEGHHSVMNCTLNMEISFRIFFINSESSKNIYIIFSCKILTEFRVILCLSYWTIYKSLTPTKIADNSWIFRNLASLTLISNTFTECLINFDFENIFENLAIQILQKFYDLA